MHQVSDQTVQGAIVLHLVTYPRTSLVQKYTFDKQEVQATRNTL